MRITSTTTSQLINTPIAPIKMSSLVAPPVGAFGANQGTLGVQVNDRDGAGVEGMNVTITGPRPSPTRRTRRAARSSPTCRSAPTPPASTAPAGSTRAATRPRRSARPSASGTVNVKTLDLRPGGERRRDLRHREPQRRHDRDPGADDHAALGLELRCAHRAVLPAAGARVWESAGGALGTISATRPLPVRRRLRPLRRRLPGRRPDEVNDPDYYTTFGADAFVDVDPGAARRSPATVRLPSINLRVLYNGARWPDLPAAPRASSSPRRARTAPRSSTTCTATATRRQHGWMHASRRCRSAPTRCASESRTPASHDRAALEGRSPASQLVLPRHEAAGHRQSGDRPQQRHADDQRGLCT